MGRFTRGFTGRGHSERDARLPPGQYDTGKSWPVLTAEVTPHLDTRHVDVPDRGTRRSADDVDLGRDPRASAVDVRRRHPLRHDVVEVRHPLQRRVGRHAARRGRACNRARRTCSRSRTPTYTTNLPLADVTNGQAWVVWEYEGRPLEPRTADRRGCSFRTSTSGRARSSSPACACSITTSTASGSRTGITIAATPGSSSATRATSGRTTPTVAPRSSPWHMAKVVDDQTRDAAREDVPPRAARADAAPRGPALRRASHRARRLHRVALVFDRVRTRRLGRVRAHGRTPRRW